MVNGKKIGMVTIGQSPREDIVPEIRKISLIDADIIECGALDGLSPKQIEELAPKPREYVLVSRLKDGTHVRVALHHLVSLMQKCIDSLNKRGVDLIVILCMGNFPDFKSEKIIVKPSKFFSKIVLGLLSEGDKLGVIVPAQDQIERAKKVFKKDNVETIVEAVSPYGENAEHEVTRAAQHFKKRNVNLIAANCPGYNLEVKEKIEEITSIPVILALSVIAWVTKELVN